MNHRFRTSLTLCVLLCLGVLSSSSISAQPTGTIVLLSPGDQSLVTSPINVRALVHPGDGGLVRVSLVDQQQTLLARQVLRISAANQDPVDIYTELAFEIPVERTTAFLSVMTQDQAKRPISIRSVPLTLQKSGEARIEPQHAAEPWLEITQPKPGEANDNSPLVVSGTVKPINDRPVIIELINERGNAIVTRQLVVKTPGELMAFDVSLPYLTGSSIQDIRLTIRQPSGIAGVNVILDSLPLKIMP